MNFTKSLTPAKILLCGAFVLVGLLSLSSICLAQDKPWTTKAPPDWTGRFAKARKEVGGYV